MEQNSRKDSSSSRISWNRLLAESIVRHLSASRGNPQVPQRTSQMRDERHGNSYVGQLRRTDDPRSSRRGRNRTLPGALFPVTAVAGKTPEPPPRPLKLPPPPRAA